MENIYLKVGVELEDVLIISTAWTGETQIKAISDDATLDLTKIHGYIAYKSDDEQIHLKFSHAKYEAYLDQLRKEQEEAWRKKDLEESQQALLDSVEILYDESKREGYVKKIFKIGELVIKETEVKLEDIPENVAMTIQGNMEL